MDLRFYPSVSFSRSLLYPLRFLSALLSISLYPISISLDLDLDLDPSLSLALSRSRSRSRQRHLSFVVRICDAVAPSVPASTAFQRKRGRWFAQTQCFLFLSDFDVLIDLFLCLIVTISYVADRWILGFIGI